MKEVKHWNRSPEGLWDLHPWRWRSKLSCAWPWATWSKRIWFALQDGPGDLWRTPPTYMIIWSYLATCFSGTKKLVSLYLTLSSTASDPDVRDTVINITMYMLKFTIDIHVFLSLLFSILERLRYLLFSMHWAFPLLFCFLHLSDLVVNSTQNRMTWGNQENMRQDKDYLEKKCTISPFWQWAPVTYAVKQLVNRQCCAGRLCILHLGISSGKGWKEQEAADAGV